MMMVLGLAGLMHASLMAARVDVYPQSFDAGGWAFDAQFMDMVGSPYLLADGAAFDLPADFKADANADVFRIAGRQY